MVIGSFVVLNTLGLLTGLPYQSNSSLENIDVNRNIITTFYNSSYTRNKWYLLFDVQQYNQGEETFGSVVNIEPFEDNGIRINFSYNNTLTESLDNIGNNKHSYIVQGFEDLTTGDADPGCTVWFENEAGASKPIPTINNVYLAVKQEDYTSLNSTNVISSITSGLGLMGDITNNFKNGFSALIWNSEKNSLTTFGNFALIFLGVSITFAIVKLCLNLIRSKTGA